MDYPHRRYITYLLSRKMQSFEVQADCMARMLVPPTDEFISALQKDIGKFPPCWKATVGRTNVPFRRWLRDLKVLRLWEQDDSVLEALRLLATPGMRKDFEALMLMHWDAETSRVELGFKYAERMIPSLKGLEAYVEFFWNLHELSPQDLFDFISVSKDRQEFLPAYQRDMVVAYGMLGLQQQIEAEDALTSAIQSLYQQIVLSRRPGELLSAGHQAGLSAMVAALDRAIHSRDELRAAKGSAGASIRAQAAQFKARLERTPGIPSLDEITRAEVIDADFAEAGSGPRLISVRGRE